MEEKMRKYTKEWQCPKCGERLCMTKYHIKEDIIIRECLTCEYQEGQLPLDRIGD